MPYLKAIAMHNILLILIVVALLSACASNGDRVENPRTPVEGSEDYKGPRTAAVTPVSDRRSGQQTSDEQLSAEIQRSIQSQLDHSGIFAGVVALDRADESNEAEVIIEPTLVGSPGYGADDVELRVRVTEKTRRKVVLDTHYQGDDPRSDLRVAIQELENDLGDRYDR